MGLLSCWLPRSATLAGIKKNPALIPLHACTAIGGLMFGCFVIRTAIRSPEFIWTRQNPEPWNDYENKHYKLYYPIYRKLENHRPKF